MSEITSIGIIGGTGEAGKSVGLLLSLAKFKVLLGSRDYTKALNSANELTSLGAKDVFPVTNQDAAEADLVIFSTPWEGTLDLATLLKDSLKGKVVISMVNSLSVFNRNLIALMPPKGSMLLEVASVLTESFVYGAFNHLPSHAILKGEKINSDVLIVGPDTKTKDIVMSVINKVDYLRALYVGGYDYSWAVESFTAVLIKINKNYKIQSSIKIIGLD
jgi:NADPH-dependent F420 reductase